MLAVIRAPRLRCTALEADRCIAAAGAIQAHARAGPSIVAIGLLGWRGCFPGAFFCGYLSNPHPPLEAAAGVEFEDGTKLAYNVSDLDPGGRVTVGLLEPVDLILRLTLPER